MKYILYRLGDAQLPVIDFNGIDIEVPLFEVMSNPMVPLTDEAFIVAGRFRDAVRQGQRDLALQIRRQAEEVVQAAPDARYLTIAIRTEPTVLAADDPGFHGKWPAHIGWVMFCILGMVATREPPTGTPEDHVFDTLPFWVRWAEEDDLIAKTRAHQAVALSKTLGFRECPEGAVSAAEVEDSD